MNCPSTRTADIVRCLIEEEDDMDISGKLGTRGKREVVPLAGLEPATPSLRITGKIFPIDLPQFRVIHFSFYFKQIADTTFP